MFIALRKDLATLVQTLSTMERIQRHLDKAFPLGPAMDLFTLKNPRTIGIVATVLGGILHIPFALYQNYMILPVWWGMMYAVTVWCGYHQWNRVSAFPAVIACSLITSYFFPTDGSSWTTLAILYSFATFNFWSTTIKEYFKRNDKDVRLMLSTSSKRVYALQDHVITLTGKFEGDRFTGKVTGMDHLAPVGNTPVILEGSFPHWNVTIHHDRPYFNIVHNDPLSSYIVRSDTSTIYVRCDGDGDMHMVTVEYATFAVTLTTDETARFAFRNGIFIESDGLHWHMCDTYGVHIDSYMHYDGAKELTYSGPDWSANLSGFRGTLAIGNFTQDTFEDPHVYTGRRCCLQDRFVGPVSWRLLSRDEEEEDTLTYTGELDENMNCHSVVRSDGETGTWIDLTFTPTPPAITNPDNPCVVCRENDRCMAFVQCGHLVACTDCMPKLEKCPVCRNENTESIRIFT